VNGVPRARSVAFLALPRKSGRAAASTAGAAPGHLSETQDSGIGRIYFPESQPARAQG